MPRGGLEPPWANAHQVLNLARLPVPPPRLRTENGSLGLGDKKSRSAPDSTLPIDRSVHQGLAPLSIHCWISWICAGSRQQKGPSGIWSPASIAEQPAAVAAST